ncbi:gephyrin-like molybdotransferase Glp [Paenibacillus sp. J22TS3]|uniref:molybdopterin molybdotransferase MoeA n=1 Tax=Paenibacillus sp. J22TS3 TaxID=2807192 RepID=UPI001B1373EC|nr:gephyrin-like molybdotransferase Glp [Paenibacillus sp. J22TS3]GIP19871.1 molybdopterin molybdenumtransferase [Paenibacillus sp. J22TS3]
MTNPNPSSKMHRSAIQVKEAQALIQAHVRQGDTEIIDLADARGRFLAQEVTAPHPYPHFRRSGMDGFAIISSDTLGTSTENPILLEVVDEIPAGSLPSVAIVPGTASRIMTGAKVPDQADAVVMLEMTEAIENQGRTLIQLKREIEPGKNITPVGFELSEGDVIMEKGRVISAGEVSVLATFGIHQVQVYKRPRVALFSTGSELLGIEEPIQDGKIRNSNTYMLACQIRDAGGEPVILDAIPDDLQIAKQRVEEAFQYYDIVVTTGGVSVGDFDIMADLVRGDDVTMLFNKVTMRPGSVTTAAVKDGKMLFALSGNPGACFVGCELFVRPAIGMMQGNTQPYLTEITAVLGKRYNKINNFTRFVRGSLQVEDGQLIAHPASLDESGVMITIKDSDCLIIVPPASEALEAGTKVRVLRLAGSSI